MHSSSVTASVAFALTNLLRVYRGLFTVIDGEYPILEHLVIWNRIEDNSTILTFLETLQALQLRHLVLSCFALQRKFRLLMTAVSLVTLCLLMDHPSAYSTSIRLLFLHWPSFMPLLETLTISFLLPVPNRHVERQLTHTLIRAPLPLPNLQFFRFQGVGDYFEALVRRITAPSFEKLEIEFFNQLTFAVLHLLQFMNTTENLTRRRTVT